MAEIRFPCPHCDKHLECDAKKAGMWIQCPSCARSICVPGETPAVKDEAVFNPADFESKFKHAFKYPHARGGTLPGSNPYIRAMPGGNVLHQQHESLHRHFDTVTTLGNSLTLLCQLADSVPDTAIGTSASQLTSAWSDARALHLERVICYVAYRRARRRDPSLAPIERLETALPSEYMEAWQDARASYDSLPLSEPSKDAMAMMIANFCMSIPLYELLSDLKSLDSCMPAVTESILHSRANALEHLLSSTTGKEFCGAYEDRVTEIQASHASAIQMSHDESAYVAQFLTLHEPNIEIVPSSNIPKSIDLADTWNFQLASLGLREDRPIKISLETGEEPVENDVVVFPPAPQVHGLTELSDLSQISDYCQSAPRCWCVCYLYEHHGEEFQLSRKYKRVWEEGDCYVRCHLVDRDPATGTITIVESMFRLPESRTALWDEIAQVSETPRIIWANAYRCEELINTCAKIVTTPLQTWRILWGRRPEDVVKRLEETEADVDWVHFGRALTSGLLFVMALQSRRGLVEVFPIVPSALPSMHSQVSGMKGIRLNTPDANDRQCFEVGFIVTTMTAF